ncbi:hypothetical protein NW762_012830 [Fusarium torreyae]|uniref:LysM domain-containing protein n=1 Tax=Fusarium torreyae TaxID=1237075 RepID=A0A9W8RNQ8_9HYPO|nr:hypothetical protein NW762_012830 [Fusarium torreyae]
MSILGYPVRKVVSDAAGTRFKRLTLNPAFNTSYLSSPFFADCRLVIEIYLSSLLAVGLLPHLPYALHIPFRRAVECGFSTSADSGATCSSFASDWGLTVDVLKSLNPGISCPDLDADGFYCVVGTVNDDPPPTAGPSSAAGVSTRVSSSSTTTTSKSTVVDKPSPTKGSSGNGIETPSPIQDGMVANCNKWHYVQSTTTCQGILNYDKISLADFVKWNPAAGKDCSGMWKETYACVGVVGSSSSPTTTAKAPATTTKSGDGISTPEPIQEGMLANCNKFHLVIDTTTCQGILTYDKISLADFSTNACVGVIGSTPSLTTTTKPKPATTTTKGNGITTPTPIQAGMVSNCNKFHLVGDSTTCQGILDYDKISLADFVKWNPAVGKDCGGLWKGTHACVGVVGSKPTPTKDSGNGVTTPTPTQAGMVKNCSKFHFIGTTTTCQGVLKYDKITLAQFVKWNPAIGKDCSGL